VGSGAVIVGVASAQVTAGVLAVLSALVYTLGLALQQKGNLAALRVRTREGARRPQAIVTITRPVWVAGFVVGLVGFGLHAVALTIGSLALVQPLQVTQMIFMVPFSAWVAKTSMRGREWGAALLVVIGLGIVLVVTQPSLGDDTGDTGPWMVMLALWGSVTSLLLVVAVRFPTIRAALLGAAAGTLYGVQGALVKQGLGVFEAEGLGVVVALTNWAIWLMLATGVAALTVQNLALRAGRLSAAQTTITVSAPVVSSVIGVVVFHEAISVGPLNLAGLVMGLAVGLWGVLLLARSPALVAVEGLAQPEGVLEGVAEIAEAADDAL
jgi:drug/metabolite transporter (DMT)-like permease